MSVGRSLLFTRPGGWWARAEELVAIVMDQMVRGLGNPYLRLPRYVTPVTEVFFEIREGAHIDAAGWRFRQERFKFPIALG